MDLLFISFLAGILTVLSPCVIPLLPVIVGGSLKEGSKSKAYLISTSLGLSVVVFTLLLKATTLLIEVSPRFWQIFSGGLVIALGLVTLFPQIWDKLSVTFGFSTKSEQLLAGSAQTQGKLQPVLIGAALGPVFSSCSPTYAIILATILPQSFTIGLLNLIIYGAGLALALLTLSIGGQKLTSKIKWAVNPEGWFKKSLGILFILVGFSIITGLEKKFEEYLVQGDYFDITKVEQYLLDKNDEQATKMLEENNGVIKLNQNNSNQNSKVKMSLSKPIKAPEIVDVANWINSGPLTLKDLKGKVVLIDFWTYSCINCIRTLPYLKSWNQKYADKGLVIIGMHAPEFAFEQKLENVQKAVSDFEITYPVALDNNFSTWKAYNNQYWPAKYFVDKNGLLRHFHFGEGDYEHSEQVIIALLEETGATVEPQTSAAQSTPPIARGQTPETYLGYWRHEYFANYNEITKDSTANYSLPAYLTKDYWGLAGEWQINNKDIVSKNNGVKLKLNYTATGVFLVMGSQDGTPKQVKVSTEPKVSYGNDVTNDVLIVTEPRLYRIIDNPTTINEGTLTLEFEQGIVANAFTFETK
ncbi:redoxin domain-containing protein [candidate division WWE3 bacterium]|uniref:Redoxin domain-containing protein n=1 Tax=candidate division WWE3 bacterium TaxID=2053526 RepID=A0A955EEJ0_UNCKA|nr:redoxin domain-containing protein [candidate division WWE3 bacterium]